MEKLVAFFPYQIGQFVGWKRYLNKGVKHGKLVNSLIYLAAALH